MRWDRHKFRHMHEQREHLQVLVIGGGEGGLAAAGAAKSMGASVYFCDKDPAVRAQVEVLGAEFPVVEGSGEAEYSAAEVFSLSLLYYHTVPCLLCSISVTAVQ